MDQITKMLKEIRKEVKNPIPGLRELFRQDT